MLGGRWVLVSLVVLLFASRTSTWETEAKDVQDTSMLSNVSFVVSLASEKLWLLSCWIYL